MPSVKVGDKVHVWVRHSGERPKCYRGRVTRVDPDAGFAAVRVESHPLAVPVLSFPIKRVLPGWNNWTDQEGRVVD